MKKIQKIALSVSLIIMVIALIIPYDNSKDKETMKIRKIQTQKQIIIIRKVKLLQI